MSVVIRKNISFIWTKTCDACSSSLIESSVFSSYNSAIRNFAWRHWNCFLQSWQCEKKILVYQINTINPGDNIISLRIYLANFRCAVVHSISTGFRKNAHIPEMLLIISFNVYVYWKRIKSQQISLLYLFESDEQR